MYPYGEHIFLHVYTAVFTYYYDPAILRNKLTPLSIFRDPALRKRDSKNNIIYFCVFYRVYTNIPKLFGLLILFWIFWAIALHVSVLEPKFSKVLTFTISRQKCCKGIFIFTLLF